jgi:broad specificity phosphatase PhoE
MKIDFVRHGESENNGKGLVTGHLDAPLTELGIEQAEETANNLNANYDIIYCSDLGRCKQTAAIINKKLNLPIIYDARLKERHFGSLEGKSWTEMPNGEELKKRDIQLGTYDYRPYNGESAEDVKKRVLECVKEIIEKNPDKKVLIVTHAGIIRLLHHVINGQIQEKIHNASIHEFEFPETGLN